jgi:hypothetical protein
MRLSSGGAVSGCLGEALGADFLGDDIKAGKRRIAKLGRDCNIRRVPTASDNDPPDTGDVVPGIEGKPSSVKKDLKTRH